MKYFVGKEAEGPMQGAFTLFVAGSFEQETILDFIKTKGVQRVYLGAGHQPVSDNEVFNLYHYLKSQGVDAGIAVEIPIEDVHNYPFCLASEDIMCIIRAIIPGFSAANNNFMKVEGEAIYVFGVHKGYITPWESEIYSGDFKSS